MHNTRPRLLTDVVTLCIVGRTAGPRFQSYLAVHDGAQAPVYAVGTAIFVDRLLATVAMHRPAVRPRNPGRAALRARR